jgi:osmotically-inducible protein OsmY
MSADAGLLVKIKETLSKDEIRHEHIHLKVVGGVVFLDGEADSEEEKETLEAEIKKVDGVRFVQNRLQVNPADTPELHKPHHTGH